MTTDRVPQLSVVIASVNGRPYIDDCLEGLQHQEGEICTEIIVTDSVGSTVTDFIQAEFPHVQLIPFKEQKNVPQLRSAGILSAKGAIVAITEDHCIPASDWFQSLVDSHQSHKGPAIGGAVDNAATNSAIDWAAFFCEYSNYISPVPRGVVHDLPGPNVSYKREVLDEMEDLLVEGYRETFLHQYLEAQGYQLSSDPSLVVRHKKHFSMGGFMKERFHYGRWYAGTRNKSITPPRRAYYLFFSPVLPLLLSARISRRVFSRGRHYREFVTAFPILFIFLIAWAVGEIVGYAFGPGESVYEIS